jgi:DNA repair exonuclease SbcCD ATPase subunit
MFKINNITVKNFLSVGAQTQAVDFDKEQLTLVLGANLDLGGDDSGSRNGTGKTTIINALSYALYGQALTNIRKENLINATNGKGMLVTVAFEKDNAKYKIERGRKPNILKFYVNDQEQKSEDLDEAQGDSRETQKYIEQLLDMSHTMFKHLVALNTYTEPFLSMKAADQREVIEQLLGITLLSEKAETLKLLVKETKDCIQAETFKIDAIKAANENIQKSISSLEIKSSAWESKKESDVTKLLNAILELGTVDIEYELKLHADLRAWEEDNKRIQNLNKQRVTLETAVTQAEKTVKKYEKELVSLANKTCHACEQELHDHKHEEMTTTATGNLTEAQIYFNKVSGDYIKIVEELGTGDHATRPT